MGVLNVTPDSFSDGGRFIDCDAAIAHGLSLWREGADLIDVGGESTRPGAPEVSAAEEVARVVPVVAALASAGVTVSIDTSKAVVAAAAVEVGAAVINDVSALTDPAMAPIAAESGCGVVLMHMQGTPRTMQADPRYGDVVVEVRDHLLRRVDHAVSAGIPTGRICLDPGIGFGKTLEHNLAILDRLDEFRTLGFPIVLGTSRKRFIGTVLNIAEPRDRVEGSAATVALGIQRGARIVRVHDVDYMTKVARMTDVIVRSSTKEQSPNHK